MYKIFKLHGHMDSWGGGGGIPTTPNRRQLDGARTVMVREEENL